MFAFNLPDKKQHARHASVYFGFFPARIRSLTGLSSFYDCRTVTDTLLPIFHVCPTLRAQWHRIQSMDCVWWWSCWPTSHCFFFTLLADTLLFAFERGVFAQYLASVELNRNKNMIYVAGSVFLIPTWPLLPVCETRFCRCLWAVTTWMLKKCPNCIQTTQLLYIVRARVCVSVCVCPCVYVANTIVGEFRFY